MVCSEKAHQRFLGLAAGMVLALSGCDPKGNRQQEAPRDDGRGRASPPIKMAAPSMPDPDALPLAEGLPIERRAIQIVHGIERTVDAQEAIARGLTLVDLSDAWAPALFSDRQGANGEVLPNRYRAVFVGLATDRSDEDGEPLPPGRKNHLELYGIPPALSVLRERFLADAARPCEKTLEPAKLLAVAEIPSWGSTTEKKELAKGRARGERLETARAAGGHATLAALAAAEPKLAKEVDAHARFTAERAAFAEVEKRLVCEAMMDPAKHVTGSYDTVMRMAVLAFQQKNVVMAQGDLTRGTLEALARPIAENNFAALRRALTERAVHAAAILEDGSVQPVAVPGKPTQRVTYLLEDGSRAEVPDLATQATDALMVRLGLGSAADAVAFFKRRAAEDFRWLRVAVRFPARPAYYGPHMDLFAEIDRGDVWYDFPFDAKGDRLPQPRERFPSFTLFVKWKGERVPLVRWRTTIGSWRNELAADGEEYLRYKGSDVGPRVWRHVVAAPVWIPPMSSPMGGMVKEKWVQGAVVKVTNYDETGPGYLSAYGLVAGIHVQPTKLANGRSGFFDNGIRTHGTFDYTSLRGRFSHGCHRLSNHLAVRLFSFVIQHRRHKPLGNMALDYRRTFWAPGGVFDMRLPTRGFYFELDPPLPIETLEGNIKGVAKKPPVGYVRKPGAVYTSQAVPPASTSPSSRAGGGTQGEAAADSAAETPPSSPSTAPPPASGEVEVAGAAAAPTPVAEEPQAP